MHVKTKFRTAEDTHSKDAGILPNTENVFPVRKPLTNGHKRRSQQGLDSQDKLSRQSLPSPTHPITETSLSRPRTRDADLGQGRAGPSVELLISGVGSA